MKSAYIEVGKKCYSSCTSCEIPHAKRPEVLFNKETLLKTIDVLWDVGFEQFRFTGYEPISCTFLNEVLECRPYITSKILTTLLRYNPVMEICTYPMVSLSAAETFYPEYFSVDHFDKFEKNFDKLSQVRQDIEINCTITHALGTRASVKSLVRFLNKYKHAITSIQMFDAMLFDTSSVDINMIQYEMEATCQVPFSITGEDNDKKLSTCNVTKQRAYVKHGGDLYPCCMAGGEIGQKLEKELLICNVMDYFEKPAELKKLLDVPLVNLNNPICDHCTPKYYTLKI